MQVTYITTDELAAIEGTSGNKLRWEGDFLAAVERNGVEVGNVVAGKQGWYGYKAEATKPLGLYESVHAAARAVLA